MVGRPKGPVWDHFEFLTEDLIAPGKTTPIKAKAAQHTWAWCKGLYREKARQLKAEHRKKRGETNNTLLDKELERLIRHEALDSLPSISGQAGILQRHVASCQYADEFKAKPKSEKDATAKTLHQMKLEMHIVRRLLSKPERQAFNRDLLDVVVGTSVAFSWVDHPLVRRFFIKWLGVSLPTRKTLTGTLLPRAVGELDGVLRKSVKGKVVTLTFDAWNNVRHQHLVAFVLTVDGKVNTTPSATESKERKAHHLLPVQPHTIAVEDTTAVSRDGALAYKLVTEQISRILKEYGVEVACVCTDSGGDCAWARRKLMEERPSLIVTPCYAHQINLIVGDLLRKSPDLHAISTELCELVTWIVNHSKAYGLLRAQQQKPLALIRPVITRWTSHAASARRLLALEKAVRTMVINEREELLTCAGKDKKAKDKAEAMVTRMEDGRFWQKLKELVDLLDPLAIAASISQASACRLDQIFLLFGRLFLEYTSVIAKEDSSPAAQDGAKVVLASLDARWAAADQEVFVVTALLNPFFGRHRRGLATAALQWHGYGLYSLIKRVYARLFLKGKTDDVPPELYAEWADYRGAKGNYSDDLLEIEEQCQQAEKKNRSPNPLAVWQLVAELGGENPLSKLALHLLSVVPNTAANERVFSSWGLIHTKTRNRLGHQLVMDAARLRAHLLADLPQRRSKRHTSAAPTPASEFLSTRSRATATANNSAVEVDDLADGGFEAAVRDWFRGFDEEEEETYEEDDAAADAPPKLTLEDVFAVDTGLEALRPVTGAEWGEGRAVMSLEEICFEGVSEEGRPVETVELGKRSRADIDLTEEGQPEEEEDVAWLTEGEDDLS